MKFRRFEFLFLLLFLGAPAVSANFVVTPWIPLFKGIDRAVGTNLPPSAYSINGVTATDNTLQVVNCVRVDLTEPTVQLFTTPRASNYVANSSETAAFTITNFMRNNGLQIVSDANFYITSQGSDPTIEGISANVEGLLVTTGQVVSAVGDNRYASLFFTANKEASVLFNNTLPGTNLAAIHTAISGFYPILSNDFNFGLIASNVYTDQTIHRLQPRTAFGLSADRRYLYIMVIDGRQQSYSNGAYDTETAFWLQVFGASDGVNMDGGGSTAMYMADCAGNPVGLGHSSYIAQYGRERIIGAHFGVYAQPLFTFINNIVAVPGSTTAIITWNTESNATSQVEYGLNTTYGTFSALDSTPVTNHSVMLSGLTPGTKYFFRALSVAGGTQYSSSCGLNSFITTNVGVSLVFGLTNNWKYQTNNFDGVNWPSLAFSDNTWSNGPAPMWADSRNPVPAQSTNTIPNFAIGTRMPISNNFAYPYPTYYLRTRFVLPNNPPGTALTFSNFLDDGAVFYLNGFEVMRINMPGGPINNATYTPSGAPCGDGNASCPFLFTLSGNSLSNLVAGTNLLAVEVHNFKSLASGTPSPDVTFETALFATIPPPPAQIITNVVATPGETNVTITWTTTTNATTQVQYGLTTALGSSNTLDATLVANHSMTLAGLQPLTAYYFRVLSTAGGNTFFSDGTFNTVPFLIPLVTGSNVWKFTTNNLDGTNWMARQYNDSAWLGQGPALLYIEDNAGVAPRVTALPGATNGAPMPTYYFRTHFNWSNSAAGFALLVTNYIDDGAVLYLNGTEIQRVRMADAPQPISYTTSAVDCPINNCEATEDVPDVFRLSGDVLTNLVTGDNVFAAEVHQFATNDTDVVFGSTVGLVRALVTEIKLQITRSTNVICVSWPGSEFTLQQAHSLGGSNDWSDVSGPIKSSPYCATNPPITTYYRLRN
jgi:hypothetical protein